METFCILACCIFTWLTVFRPLVRECQRAQARRDAEKLYYFKLRWVRRCYPELSEMPFHEIEERFDVEGAYERIRYEIQ